MTDSPMEAHFEVLLHTRDDDSYFYSNTDYDWAVVCQETGDCIFEFHGRDYQGRGAASSRGAEDVSLSEDRREVVITDFDGKAERKELPVKVALADDGAAIELTWPGGRIERRDRKAVMFITKYGQPTSRKLVNDPSDR